MEFSGTTPVSEQRRRQTGERCRASALGIKHAVDQLKFGANVVLKPAHDRLLELCLLFRRSPRLVFDFGFGIVLSAVLEPFERKIRG
jgi:hypothetical protein